MGCATLSSLTRISRGFPNHVPSSDILPFDQYIPSTRLQPIDFPQYRSIDSLDRWTILRLGMRNRLQTRRDTSTINWLDVDTYFDVDFDNPLAQVDSSVHVPAFPVQIRSPPERALSPMCLTGSGFNRCPGSIFPSIRRFLFWTKGFGQSIPTCDWTINPNIEVRVGHQYLQSNPYYQDTSELSFYTYLRLNDNWGFSVYEDYQFKTGMINQQTYAIHRDLSSWVGALGLNITNNGSGKQPDRGRSHRSP